MFNKLYIQFFELHLQKNRFLCRIIILVISFVVYVFDLLSPQLHIPHVPLCSNLYFQIKSEFTVMLSLCEAQMWHNLQKKGKYHLGNKRSTLFRMQEMLVQFHLWKKISLLEKGKKEKPHQTYYLCLLQILGIHYIISISPIVVFRTNRKIRHKRLTR